VRRLLVLLFFGVSPYIISQVTVRPKNYQAQDFIWNEQKSRVDSDTLLPGIAVYWESYVDYRKNGISKFKVHLKEPVKVFEAKKQQAWGFVQFPKIFRTYDGRIAATWSMNPDDIRVQNKDGWKYSKDNGVTWTYKWNDRPNILGHKLPNGDYLKMVSLFPKVDTMELPIPYLTEREKNGKIWNFYEEHKVRDNYTGFFQNRLRKGSESILREKASKLNTTALSYSQNGVFSQQAWGDIKTASNGSLIKCIYPGFHKDSNGGVLTSGIDFYISVDNGNCWDFQGSVAYNSEASYKGKKRLIGYQEPTFEVLDNGNLVCIMRSSAGYEVGDMFMSSSKDLGKTWTKPNKIANNGVSPQLHKLKNGVKILSSGRPGVQLRFSVDSLAKQWSEPFEMMRYHGLSGQVSCGYTGILPLSDNSFLVVYSNFRNRDDNNNLRKAIFVREVVIDSYK